MPPTSPALCAYKALRGVATLIECLRPATHGPYCKQHYKAATADVEQVGKNS